MTPNADTNPPEPNSTWRRIHRAGSLLFYLALLGWIAWIAVTRWYGKPVDPEALTQFQYGISLPIDPDTDRTEELQEAFDHLPPIPTFTLPPPPEGMKWEGTQKAPSVLRIWDALAGEWTPETRPVLAAIIKYLELPEVTRALELIASIGPGGIRSANHSAMRETMSILVARMRYQCAQRNSVDAMFEDYQTALRLSALNYGSGTLIHMFVGTACETAAHVEFIRLAMEFPLSQDRAWRARTIIEQESPDHERLWQAWSAAQMFELRLLVQSFWTHDDNGGGWLVLSEWHGSPAPPPAEASCGAWNLLSPVFSNRSRVLGKIAGLEQAYNSVSRMSYAEGKTIVIDATGRFAFNHLDGPIVYWFAPRPVRYLEVAALRTAWRRAAMVVAALSAYRSDHGHYPDVLAELQTEYLQTALLDPFVNEDFRYGWQNNDAITLYSVGPNCVDDDGVAFLPTSTSGIGDYLFVTPRAEPTSEPILERIEQDDKGEATRQAPGGDCS
jgi:hypothetical protein